MNKKTCCDRHSNYVKGCPECQELKRIYQRGRLSAKAGPRKIYGPAEITHGVGGYQYHRCGCPVCLGANRERYQRWRKRKAQERWAAHPPAALPPGNLQPHSRLVKSAAEILRTIPTKYL